MRKITLLLGLVMLFPTFAHAGLAPEPRGDQYQSPLYNPKDATPAERKLLNGDSDGQPAPVPEGDPGDHGSSGCKDDDCERGE